MLMKSVYTEVVVMSNDLTKSFAVVLLILMGIAGYFCIEFTSNPFSAIVAEESRVGVLFDGKLDDGGWNETQHEGFESLKNKLHVQVFYNYFQPDDSVASAKEGKYEISEGRVINEDEAMKRIDQLVNDDRVSMVFSTSEEYAGVVEAAARKYKDVKFFQLRGQKGGENMASYYARMYQACYMSGVVAGNQTATGHIGYVSARHHPMGIAEINAFALGARSVNPQAVVHVRWSGVRDPERDKVVANKLIDELPVDVIATNQRTSAVLEVADARGIQSIAYNAAHAEMYPDTFLVAPTWHWGDFYEVHLRACMEGRFKGMVYVTDISEGFFGLSELSPLVKPGTDKLVHDVMERFRSRRWGVFYGPIYDQSGVLRVTEDEIMSDEEILQKFDWFVQGIEGSIAEE